MKRYVSILVVLLPLLMTACVFESKEVTQAKAEYIDAKTRKLEAEAERLELENRQTEALQAQLLEQKQKSFEAAEARRAVFERILVETLRVLAYIVVATVVVVSLAWAMSGAYQVGVRSQQELLQASAQKAREERLAQEAKANALVERRNLIEAEAHRLEQERLLLELMTGGNGRISQPVVSIK
jgi:hypothetical protein